MGNLNPMVTKRLQEMLLRQVAMELGAHSHYMGISIYFKKGSLDKWAKLFHDQSTEEAGHAAKIIAFLIDNNVEFDLPGVVGAATKYESPLAAVKSAYEAELKVSASFQAIAMAAIEEQDYRSFEFVQWFISEQVEEESSMQKLIDILESGLNPFQAQHEI